MIHIRDIIKKMGVVGEHPPRHPLPGDIWFNPNTDYFYILDEHDRWVATDGDLVADIIQHYEVEDEYEKNKKSFERAMGIIK